MTRSQKNIFKKEEERTLLLVVPEEENILEWGDPTYIKPKTNGTARSLSHFRKLNQRTRREPFMTPKIQDMLLNH